MIERARRYAQSSFFLSHGYERFEMYGDIPASIVGPDEESETEVKYVVPKNAPKQSKVSEHLSIIKTSNLIEIMEDEMKIKFLVEEMLPDTGLVYLGGISGTGKTTLAIQLAVNMVLSKDTMTWKLGKDIPQTRMLFLSLEMGRKQLQQRLNDMYHDTWDEQERKLIIENFDAFTEAEGMKLWEDDSVVELLRAIKHGNYNVVLIDSASVGFAPSLKDDALVNKSLANLQLIRNGMRDHPVAMIVVAHTRKPQPGVESNPADASINDLFGHSGVAQSADSIYLLIEDEKQRRQTIKDGNGEEVEKLVHIINVKSRFGSTNAAFKSKMSAKVDVDKGDCLMFRRDAIMLPGRSAAAIKRDRRNGETPEEVQKAIGEIDFTKFMRKTKEKDDE